MEITNLKLKQLVTKTYAMIVNHVYGYGEAHKTASTDQNGFLAKEDKKNIDYYFRYCRNTASNVDIMGLKPGIYAARNWVNSPIPTDEVLIVDVRRAVNDSDGAMVINAYDTSRGDFYFRSVYLNGDHDSGWKKVQLINV